MGSLPTEIIQHIYFYLGPQDFNAARHICRPWLTASLDRGILTLMLRRGGWWGSASSEIRARNGGDDAYFHTVETQEWLLSCQIARECALQPYWGGNGVTTLLSSVETEALSSYGPLLQAATVELNNLSSCVTHCEAGDAGIATYSCSACGNFLLIASGNVIFVYCVKGHDLSLITSIVCPRRVTRIGTDNSDGQLTLAALLDGRMALVCALHMDCDPCDRAPSAARKDSHSDNRQDRSFGVSTFTSSRFPQDHVTVGKGNPHRETDGTRHGERERERPLFNSIVIHTGNEDVNLHHTDDARRHAQNFINQTWNLRILGPKRLPFGYNSHSPSSQDDSEGFSVAEGPHKLYRHLCSEMDPPRSVAICSRRRCVAFGCSSGVELHWVDTVTGEDLNRWFPLSAPSDFLYFMPSCCDADSAGRLRVMSSTKYLSDASAEEEQSLESVPCLNLPWGSWSLRMNLSKTTAAAMCDHYRAVPLSDGFHVLFIDPAGGKLCLGTNAPLGAPLKLFRRVVFLPPEGGSVPTSYAAGAALTGGLRVAAAYDDEIVLYSVPADVLVSSRAGSNGSGLQCGADDSPRPMASREDEPNMDWLDWWPYEEEADDDSHSSAWSPWPLYLRGIPVGRLVGLVELAVHNGPPLTIWAFGSDGKAAAWQLDRGKRPSVVAQRAVVRNGSMADIVEVDGDGDVHMKDCPEPSTASKDFTSTGVTRVPRAFHLANDAGVDLLDVSPGSQFDEDGDLIMTDAPVAMSYESGGGVVHGGH